MSGIDAAELLEADGQGGEEPGFPAYDIGPYLQGLTSRSAIIVAQTAQETIGRLEYGPAEAPGAVLEEVEPAHDHVFRLEELQPGTRYRYRLTLGNDQPPIEATFRTLPLPGGEVTVAILGDSGAGTQEQIELAARLVSYAPNLVAHTGDIVYDLGLPELFRDHLFSIYERLLPGACFYPTLGNHDCFFPPDYWLYAFHLPANNPAADERYYSFDAGDAHFATVNSCNGDVAPAELEWLAADLKASVSRWKIVFFHHPPYANSSHGGDAWMRREVVPILERSGVDLVLGGHEHVYERSFPVRGGAAWDAYQEPDYIQPRGIIYVVSGGGGAALYAHAPGPDAHLSAVFHSRHHYVALRCGPDSITGEAIGLDGAAIDAFSIRKRGDRPPVPFVRGDTDQDGDLDLADPIAILDDLFLGSSDPCLAASDVDASGSLLVTDAIHALDFLFQGRPPPPAPFPDCGIAAGADDRGCRGVCQ